MSIVSEIESLYSSLKAKVGEIPAEVESFFASHVAKVKAEEDAKAQAEAAHLQSMGWTVTPPAAEAPANPAAPVEGASIA